MVKCSKNIFLSKSNNALHCSIPGLQEYIVNIKPVFAMTQVASCFSPDLTYWNHKRKGLPLPGMQEYLYVEVNIRIAHLRNTGGGGQHQAGLYNDKLRVGELGIPKLRLYRLCHTSLQRRSFYFYYFLFRMSGHSFLLFFYSVMERIQQ